MSGLLIPDDWNEPTDGFCTMSVTVPNSAAWRAIVRGALYALSLPSEFDADTGNADIAASVGSDIFNSVIFNCP